VEVDQPTLIQVWQLDVLKYSPAFRVTSSGPSVLSLAMMEEGSPDASESRSQ
jgi:hypothetical protein